MTSLRVAASLALLGVRSASAEWHQMPNGLYYHSECIHQFDSDFHVEDVDGVSSRISFKDGSAEDMLLPPCPHKARDSPPAAEEPSTGKESEAAQIGSPRGYYSDWAVYAQTTHSAGFGLQSTEWNVPAVPTSKGPAPPLVESSIYLFNGLENSGGKRGTADVILQPVLQYGKSGCLLNPLKWGAWYFTAYQVGANGRAYCGSNIGPLKEGEQVLGVMTLTDVKTNTWRTDATRLSTGQTSTHSTALGNRTMDAAYATLEAMVIYNCKAYPASGSVTFSNNSLKDRDGAEVEASWQKEKLHTECNQDVQFADASSGTVKLLWEAAQHEMISV